MTQCTIYLAFGGQNLDFSIFVLGIMNLKSIHYQVQATHRSTILVKKVNLVFLTAV